MQNKCNSCGSEKVIKGLQVYDHLSGLSKIKLSIHVDLHPNAILMKDTQAHPISSSVCIDCGAVGLYIDNPERLYQDYLESEGRR